jgi:hypothetical protein
MKGSKEHSLVTYFFEGNYDGSCSR